MVSIVGNVISNFNEFMFSFGMKHANDFFERASFEAVSIMVFFQVLPVSFILYKCLSMLHVAVWISVVFLIYSFAGPYFCIKWLLVLSSVLWQMMLLFWTYPYLLAVLCCVYGFCRLCCYFYRYLLYREARTRNIDSGIIKNIEQLEKKVNFIQSSINDLNDLIVTLQSAKSSTVGNANLGEHNEIKQKHRHVRSFSSSELRSNVFGPRRPLRATNF